MKKKFVISFAPLLAIVVFAVMPAAAQAVTQTLVSGATNSLCINPHPGFEPEIAGKENYAPLFTSSGTGKPFPEGPSNCTTATTATVVPSPVWSGKITGASWVSFNTTGEDGANPPPKYYIYNATFKLCQSQAEKANTLEVHMYADKTTGLFLNGTAIGHLKYENAAFEHENFSGPPAGGFPFTATGPFTAGVNTVQFVVLDENFGLSPAYTGLDFSATITSGPCTPHWYSNNVLVSAEPTQTISWGRITLSVVKGGVPGSFATCKKSDAGNVWNPVGGGAGQDNTVLFDLYECEGEKICPPGTTSIKGTSSRLPWATELIEPSPGVIRDETKMMRMTIECEEAGKVVASIPFIGSLKPKVLHGTSALHPGYEEFEPASGELEVEGSGGTITVALEGVDKQQGFVEQELINAKS
jgi:hypothetical protein